MKASIIFFVLSFLFCSCATKQRQVIAGGTTGLLMGGAVGKELSPNKESDPYNIVFGAITGGVVGAVLGAYFWDDSDPLKDLEKPQLDIPGSDKKDTEKFLNLGNNIFPDGIQDGSTLISPTEKDLKENGVDSVVTYLKKYKTKKKVFYKDGKIITIQPQEVIEQGAIESGNK